MINYVDLSITDSVLKDSVNEKIQEVFNTGRYIMGPFNNELEFKLKEFLNVRYAICVNSGTDALILSLRALGIKTGDEVITVGNSFIATVEAIVAVGAIPILVDVDDSRNICVEEIKRNISKKTKAIIPVHLDGNPAEIDAICQIADSNDIYVIEDAAQAIGAKYNNKYVGTFGTIGCFSFHPLKTLGGAGDGGVIVTNRKWIFERITKLRNHGLISRDEVECWGLNSRLDEIQAAILCAKFDYLDKSLQVRKKYAEYYINKLKKINSITFPKEYEYSEQSYNTFLIFTDKRNELNEFLLSQGIECKIHYPIPINKQLCYIKDFGEKKLVKTEQQTQKILSLPIHESHSFADIQFVSEKIKYFFEGRDKVNAE